MLYYLSPPARPKWGGGETNIWGFSGGRGQWFGVVCYGLNTCNCGVITGITTSQTDGLTIRFSDRLKHILVRNKCRGYMFWMFNFAIWLITLNPPPPFPNLWELFFATYISSHFTFFVTRGGGGDVNKCFLIIFMCLSLNENKIFMTTSYVNLGGEEKREGGLMVLTMLTKD